MAASDPGQVLASPVETVPAPALERVVELVGERSAVRVLVGLPTSLSGAALSSSADLARAFAAELEQRVAVAVELVDERLTTVTATAQLRAAGKRGKAARQVVDQVAAVALLQGWLDRR